MMAPWKHAKDREMWDKMVQAGFAPGYAAGTILRILRNPPWPDYGDNDAALRWFYREIVRRAAAEIYLGPYTKTFTELWEWLTPEEHARLKSDMPPVVNCVHQMMP